MDIKPLARTVAISALFLIPFIPLYVANSLFFPFITGKAFAFRVLVEIAFFSWLILAIADPKYRPKFSWPLVWLSLLTAWMAIANAFGVNPLKAFFSNYERMDGWVTLVHVFMLFVVAGSLFAGEKLMEKWWRVFLVGAGLVVAYGFFQIFGWATINQGGVRVDSTFGNAAYLAAYLLFVIPVAVWQATVLRGAWRYVLIALAALAAVVLFFTATRGALVGFAAGTVAALATYTFIGSGVVRKVTGVALVMVGLLIGGFMAVRDAAWVHANPTLGRLASISIEDLATRADIWSIAVKGIQERPVLGWGQEGFNQVFNKHYEPALFEQETWFDRAHNVYLDWAVAGGIPAALFFLLFLGTVAWSLVRHGKTPAERAILAAAVVAYGVQGLVVFDNLLTYVSLAFLAAMAHGHTGRTCETAEKLPTPSREVVTTMIAPVVLVAALVTIYMVNAPGHAAARGLIGALQERTVAAQIEKFTAVTKRGSFATQEIREQISLAAVRAASTDAPMEDRVAFLQFALDELGKEIARVPGDARLYTLLSPIYRTLGETDMAAGALQKARELSPRKQALFLEEGMIFLMAQRFEEASVLWREAFELDTSFDELRIYAAAGAIAAGDVAEGKALLMERFGTTAIDSEILSYAFYTSKQYTDLVGVWEARVAAAPSDAEKRFGLATAYAIAGRIADARRTAEEIEEEFPGQVSQVAAFLQALAAGNIR